MLHSALWQCVGFLGSYSAVAQQHLLQRQHVQDAQRADRSSTCGRSRTCSAAHTLWHYARMPCGQLLDESFSSYVIEGHMCKQ